MILCEYRNLVVYDKALLRLSPASGLRRMRKEKKKKLEFEKGCSKAEAAAVPGLRPRPHSSKLLCLKRQNFS